MPIYEYMCSCCATRFEKLVMSKTAEIKCSNCGSADVKRELSVFGFKSGSNFTSSVGGGGCGT